jgi:hypothetical protein
MTLIIEFMGAILILVPFALLQAGRTSPHSPFYLWLNLIGSGMLAVVAWVGQQWGFVLVQVAWTVAAGWGLSPRRRRARRVPDREVGSTRK